MKDIPELLNKEINRALSFYPQLNDVTIKFILKDSFGNITMKAQPSFFSFFRRRHRRSYNVYISKKFINAKEDFPITDLPYKVLVGWIGHELGHVMDYEQMSNFQLIRFGLNYILFDEHYHDSEYNADFFAVRQGMEEYLILQKNYVLEHHEINEGYKEKFREHYLSPEDIICLVKEREM